jgi:sugar phosphate isomerase/epimerase
MTDRREFIGLVTAAAAAAVVPGRLMAWSPVDHLDRIGVQLYTVRKALAQDFDGTLGRLARIGFREVEFAGYHGKSPAEVRTVLTRHRLDAPAAHVSLEELEAGWDAAAAAAKEVGHRWLVVAWIDAARRKTLDDYKRVGEVFTRIGTQSRAAGLRFAYHNHAFEFAPLGGRVPYDVLLESTDPAVVEFELDLYWITDGGGDPLAYFRRWPGRFPLVHIKDKAADGKMVDVGAGGIDWKAILHRRKEAGIRHAFVEHDDPPDPLASVAASYAYLKQLKF